MLSAGSISAPRVAASARCRPKRRARSKARTSAVDDATGATTFGQAWKRLPRLETDRIIHGRSTALVTTARWGCCELQDGSGTAIITDA